MKLLERIREFFSNGYRGSPAVFGPQENRYEASVPFDPDRSYRPGFVRDARYDANSFTRWELARKIRYDRRNCWLLARHQEVYTKWSVGPNGLQVIPDSSDPEWNKRMLEDYQEWSESPCLDSTLTMPQVHRSMAGEKLFDGELFLNFTHDKAPGKQATPALQLIESHRCSTPGTEYSTREVDDLVDGVQLRRGANGQPTKPEGYWIKDGFDGDAWTFRSTDQMHHVFDPHRVGMYRDITPYHTVLNPIGDLEDLGDMEMQRAKQNSEIAYLVKTASGELNGNLRRESRYGTVPTATTETDKQFAARINQYRKILGSRVVSGRKDDEWQQWANSNPSAATQWYWLYKTAQVCSAVGIPLLVCFPEFITQIQGTVVRGIYDEAHEFFRSQYFLFAVAARKIYRYRAQWARYNVKDLADAPADWAKCHVIPPRAINVDIGNQSAATLAELEAGITNWDDIAGRHGTTAEVLIRKKVKNVAMIKKICAEVSSQEGVEVLPAEVSAPIADVLQKMATANQANAAAEGSGDDEGDSPKKKNRMELAIT